MNPVEQHLQTRRAAGLFDFSIMGLYELRESEAIARVQTREIAAIERGQAAYTLLLNDDGSVFNDATVWNLGDARWWLFTGRPGDFAWLRDRADARNRSGEHAILALQGPASGRILARLVGDELVRQLRYFRFVESGAMWIARLGYSGELGYELLVARSAQPRLTQSLLDLGAPEGLCECGFEAADSLRIESGYVLFDREIDGKANPAELGLERLVGSASTSFEVRRKLVGLEIGDCGEGAEPLPVQLTSQCWSPTLQKNLALGFAAPSFESACVVPLPFYDPQRKRPRAPPL
jgi:glycine cleavage system aminomethyltransferase T